MKPISVDPQFVFPHLLVIFSSSEELQPQTDRFQEGTPPHTQMLAHVSSNNGDCCFWNRV
jgi:hypothetical protein